MSSSILRERFCRNYGSTTQNFDYLSCDGSMPASKSISLFIGIGLLVLSIILFSISSSKKNNQDNKNKNKKIKYVLYSAIFIIALSFGFFIKYAVVYFTKYLKQYNYWKRNVLSNKGLEDLSILQGVTHMENELNRNYRNRGYGYGYRDYPSNPSLSINFG